MRGSSPGAARWLLTCLYVLANIVLRNRRHWTCQQPWVVTAVGHSIFRAVAVVNISINLRGLFPRPK
ncbi:chorismate mutase/prephenate dehydratase [Histoplasma capsulatum var. duboisii H88]|uniref:Chorismate mutase/prephenate dehydratase n=1 Tax=Ajellomyces capsulatus (strain H88) TaxID=544711 RepID=A0A8A1LV68_AJEC8|nr:chorismate mutase/prephenate dehydratase [Histoplasma capsulatum var. duboisii H88]